MTIPYRIVEDVCIITPLSLRERSKELRILTKEIVSDPKIKAVIFNLAEVNFLDSETLGIFVDADHKMAARSGRCMICAANRQPSEILKVFNLAILPMYATEEEALASLNNT